MILWHYNKIEIWEREQGILIALDGQTTLQSFKRLQSECYIILRYNLEVTIVIYNTLLTRTHYFATEINKIVVSTLTDFYAYFTVIPWRNGYCHEYNNIYEDSLYYYQKEMMWTKVAVTWYGWWQSSNEYPQTMKNLADKYDRFDTSLLSTNN